MPHAEFIGPDAWADTGDNHAVWTDTPAAPDPHAENVSFAEEMSDRWPAEDTSVASYGEPLDGASDKGVNHASYT